MEKKIFPRETWNPILKSMKELNKHVKTLPKAGTFNQWEIKARKDRAEEERKKRGDPSFNRVSGTFINKTKRKNGGGDMPPRHRFILAQIARDRAAGKYSSSEEE